SHINFFDNQKVKPVSENSLNFVVYHSSKDNTSTNNLIFDNLKKQKKDFIFIIDAPKDLTNYIEQSSNPFSVKQINCFKDTQCVILSRFDAVDSGEFELSDSNKALWASYSYNNKMFTTLLLNEGTFSSKYFNKNKSITRLIDFIKSRDEPVILIGGFNSVPWSKRFKSLETEASLFSKSGLEPNWPSVLPLPLRLPLDHIYAHPGINLFNVGLQAIPDSNYRAISGTLSIPK
ncbi:MAG: endonuclease/exonuclease/phosphatase family protein, partial [Alphaproteobacteria bacterium]